MKIGLVFGGNFSESDVSRMTAKGIKKALSELNYEVIDIDFHFETIIQDIINSKADVVFNAMHGTFGEDGRLPAILDVLKIPYTHSGVLGSALAMDKITSKHIFKSLNINVADYIQVTKEELLSNNWKQKVFNHFDLSKTQEFFCKPIADGSSRDTFHITDINNFIFHESDFQTNSSQFMIEEKIFGKEINVGILQNKAIGLMEVQVNKNKHTFFNYNAKYFDDSTLHILPDIEQEIAEKIMHYGELVHNTLKLKCISRAEFILTPENKIYIIETNSHPGFTPHSLVPDIASRKGINYNQLVNILVLNAEYDR